jgi:hypothetical protein
MREDCINMIPHSKIYCSDCLKEKFKIVKELDKLGLTRSQINRHLFRIGFPVR